MEYLLVQNESTIVLTPYLDSNDLLQIGHTSGNLVDNGDALQAEDPGSSIRIKGTRTPRQLEGIASASCASTSASATP
ncbi:hypothetical protein G6O69_33575 [Pseudenhygromyxa sp. WMMC2535]|uniref:hypothetical protein n=1 Tax=Pseudenhygromyxa sp. WMMC2535 TaxID=2712867 RepID=UPI001553DCD5|nr:hypothetical protein [Pseudenhygromyxa sp. WMMC2535]NVB42801.1 hypothetical protein [Pseudenhygromyxa sp. WMMC2535]